MKKRIVVCGGRNFTDVKRCYDVLDHTINGETEIEIVSGHAKGADAFAEAYAKEKGIELTVFPADWARYGRAAGPMRNKEMLDYAQEANPLVIAFWDGKSKGTGHMIGIAQKRGVEVRIVSIAEKGD